jgi:hypothetical protein
MAKHTKVTSTGATVTTVPANAFTTVAPKRTTTKATKGAAVASPLPTAQTPVPAPASPVPVVALRTGPVVQAVNIGPKVYRVKAAHTLQAWTAVQQLMATGPAPMPAVLDAIKAHPSVGGATGFVQYCLRRGYLVAA